jgi:aminoglycoside 3-N-acetyltransferase
MTGTVTQGDIVAGLRELGVREGQQLLVHSSLSSLGWVEGGAETVIDALLQAVGASGTVMVPTLTGNEWLSPDNPPVFDPVHTPCWTGIIPETVRKRPAALRSLHPTHSVAAIGADAWELTEGHRRSVMPCDELSPYGRLAQSPLGYILLLGVGHERSTTFHHVEELVDTDYHMQQGFARARIIVDGRETYRHVMLHRYGTPRNFAVMEPLFLEQGIQRMGPIGRREPPAQARLVEAAGMVRATRLALIGDKHILCRRRAEDHQGEDHHGDTADTESGTEIHEGVSDAR